MASYITLLFFLLIFKFLFKENEYAVTQYERYKSLHSFMAW